MGNLFTSYVYESPVLDTTDDFKRSAAHDESECEEGGFLIGDSFKEKFCTLVIHLIGFLSLQISKQVLKRTYESPVLCMVDGFRDTSFEEKESEEKFVVEDSNQEEEDNFGIMGKTKNRDEVIVGEKQSSSRFEKCTSLSLGYDDQENGFEGAKENLFGQDNSLCFEKILEQNLEAQLYHHKPVGSVYANMLITLMMKVLCLKWSKILPMKKLALRLKLQTEVHCPDSKPVCGVSFRKPVHRSNCRKGIYQNEEEQIGKNKSRKFSKRASTDSSGVFQKIWQHYNMLKGSC
ncbi:hypothetical protein SLEP1_g8949 [Rubroshorea leprosula]|uniref:Uncharacterized protein n=1 Tax=Rubroshorea leprosula TaxID=152421 RepID=A0AAV5IBC9_9ROSI|nr:hypothetical protein SLEP1_g8949 [Rubroshorea leprosula]